MFHIIRSYIYQQQSLMNIFFFVCDSYDHSSLFFFSLDAVDYFCYCLRFVSNSVPAFYSNSIRRRIKKQVQLFLSRSSFFICRFVFNSKMSSQLWQCLEHFQSYSNVDTLRFTRVNIDKQRHHRLSFKHFNEIENEIKRIIQLNRTSTNIWR